jgi:putative phage-type endonuclease
MPVENARRQETTVRRVSEYATEILPADGYLSDEWHELRRETVSASEVAAILGLSPWVSAFDLWWEKRTGESSQAETQAMTRGKRREQAIREDFQDEHPELIVATVGLCRNDVRPWQTCTPDALVYEYGGPQFTAVYDFDAEPVGVLEAKTDGGGGGWGDDGSDEIPVYYRTQVLWQMDCVGVNVAYIPVWHGFGYREYVVEYHEADVLLMRAAAQDFLTSVADDRQPDIDAHVATGRRLRKLHPSVVDDAVDIPRALAGQWRAADRLVKAATERRELAANRIRAVMGNSRTALVDGDRVFTRSVYDVKERRPSAVTPFTNSTTSRRSREHADRGRRRRRSAEGDRRRQVEPRPVRRRTPPSHRGEVVRRARRVRPVPRRQPDDGGEQQPAGVLRRVDAVCVPRTPPRH